MIYEILFVSEQGKRKFIFFAKRAKQIQG